MTIYRINISNNKINMSILRNMSNLLFGVDRVSNEITNDHQDY